MRIHEMYQRVYSLIASNARMPASFAQLPQSVVEQEGESEFLTALRSLDLATEQQRLTGWLRAVLESEPPKRNIAAYWFGLFDAVREDGSTSCELYVAGSTCRPGDDDWAASPSYWPEQRYAGSQILGKIRRLAQQSGAPATHGESFCLGYAALAVADLCRELHPQLVGQRKKRQVAVGFDDGDEWVVGEITKEGFVPAEYEPPALPTILPTPNKAPFFLLEDDPRGRWSLDEPTTQSGEELPLGFAAVAEPVTTEPLVATIMDEAPGIPCDFTFAVLGTPIVSKRVVELVATTVGSTAQFIPVRIDGQLGEYWVFNVLTSHACLDLDRSRYLDREPDGRVHSLLKAVLDAKRLPRASVFRIKEYDSEVVVSRELKMLLERNKVSGICYKPVWTSDPG